MKLKCHSVFIPLMPIIPFHDMLELTVWDEIVDFDERREICTAMKKHKPNVETLYRFERVIKRAVEATFPYKTDRIYRPHSDRKCLCPYPSQPDSS